MIKIDTIYARNVPRVHGHKHLDDDATGCSSISDRLVKLHPLAIRRALSSCG